MDATTTNRRPKITTGDIYICLNRILVKTNGKYTGVVCKKFSYTYGVAFRNWRFRIYNKLKQTKCWFCLQTPWKLQFRNGKCNKTLTDGATILLDCFIKKLRVKRREFREMILRQHTKHTKLSGSVFSRGTLKKNKKKKRYTKGVPPYHGVRVHDARSTGRVVTVSSEDDLQFLYGGYKRGWERQRQQRFCRTWRLR